MQEKINNKLSQAILKQFGKVSYFLQAGNVSRNVMVHEMRKAFKRIRALLRFYYQLENDFPKRAGNNIAELGRQLSVLRNSWVNLHLFEKLSSEDICVADSKLKMVRESLAQKNSSLIKQKGLSDEGIAELQGYELNLRWFLEENLLEFQKDIGGQLRLSYEKAYLLFQDEGIWHNTDRVHDLRKRLKVLYYQVDFLKKLFPKFFKLKSDQLNVITELLGEEHDLFVLLEELGKPEYDLLVSEYSAIENKVNYLSELLRMRYQSRIRKFFNEGTEGFNKKLEAVIG